MGWPTLHEYVGFAPGRRDGAVAPTGGHVLRLTAAATLNTGDLVYFPATTPTAVAKSLTNADYATFAGVVVGGQLTGYRAVLDKNGLLQATAVAAATVGQTVLVQHNGIAQAVAGNTIAAGDRIMIDTGTSGRVKTLSGTNYTLGIALDAATVGTTLRIYVGAVAEAESISSVPASSVTAGTFAAGDFVFQGAITFGTNLISNIAFATPGALVATGLRNFASTVSGNANMGFGTTNDVTLMNRAGTAVLGVTANTVNVTVAGALAYVTNLISTTALATPGAIAATQYTAFASTVSGASVMGFGTTNDVTLMNRAGTAVFGIIANTANLSMTGSLASTTAIATPGALGATQFTGFASTVSGASIMGFGTTNDVSLMNRAGTVVLGIGPNTTNVNLVGKISNYNSIVTAGIGTPIMVASARSLAQVAAVASVATFTVGAADASFCIGANVNVTTATTHSFSVTCAYTDETNVVRTLTIPFVNVAGTAIVTLVANALGTVPYMGILTQIRCKAATNITIATTGTFTTVVYNVEGSIKQIA